MAWKKGSLLLCGDLANPVEAKFSKPAVSLLSWGLDTNPIRPPTQGC